MFLKAAFQSLSLVVPEFSALLERPHPSDWRPCMQESLQKCFSRYTAIAFLWPAQQIFLTF